MKRILLVLILVLAFGFTSVEAQNFSTHQVKKGETIEAISKRYFVTPFDIYKLNPDAKKDLKPNTVLIIPISKAKKPTITINKELQGFNEHKTKRKETLYSLSKKYNVSEDDIKKYNKFLYSNTLRKGDRLQIPKYKITKIVEELEATKRYTVQPKEGKWRIAYKFGVTVEELEVLNPGITEVLKEGDVINVPNLKDEAEKQFDDQYSYYKVLPKEGFYRLKLKLDLEQDQLEALNPELKEIGLKSGMILKIPHSDAIEGLIEGESEVVNLVNSISDFETKHIAIMLPFRMHRVDFDSISDAKKSLKKDPYLNVSLDFHSGVLMALDSLKTLGIAIGILSIIFLSYHKSEKSANSAPVIPKKYWFLPLSVFLGSCIIDSTLFLMEAEKIAPSGDISFVIHLFFFAFVAGLVLLILQLVKGNRLRLEKKDIIAGICLGIPNFFSIYLLMEVIASGWDASVVFPINNVGILSCSAIMGFIIFRERITQSKIVGLIMAIIAIVLISY